MFKVPEQYRITTGFFASDETNGNNGAFKFKLEGDVSVFCIASDGMHWDHVSVSLPDQKRCPSWEQMCEVKSLFWSEGDCVVQFHPPQDVYVNNHPYTLHLWRAMNNPIQPPPIELV